jgi:hypothetical protein
VGPNMLDPHRGTPLGTPFDGPLWGTPLEDHTWGTTVLVAPWRIPHRGTKQLGNPPNVTPLSGPLFGDHVSWTPIAGHHFGDPHRGPPW